MHSFWIGAVTPAKEANISDMHLKMLGLGQFVCLFFTPLILLGWERFLYQINISVARNKQ